MIRWSRRNVQELTRSIAGIPVELRAVPLPEVARNIDARRSIADRKYAVWMS